MSTQRACCCAILVHAWAARAETAAEAHTIVVGRFSVDDIGKPVPEGWRELSFDPKKFPKKSTYEMVCLGDEYVLKASTRGNFCRLQTPRRGLEETPLPGLALARREHLSRCRREMVGSSVLKFPSPRVTAGSFDRTASRRLHGSSGLALQR